MLTQNNDSAYAELTLEQLIQINPDILFLMKSEDRTVLEDWQDNPLWKELKAVKNNQVFIVDRNLWTRFRGVISGEEMIKKVLERKVLTVNNITIIELQYFARS